MIDDGDTPSGAPHHREDQHGRGNRVADDDSSIGFGHHSRPNLTEVLDEPLPMGGQRGKAADADCQSPRGPAIGQRKDPDRCRSPIPAGCGCRNYSHPNSAADHSACGSKSGNADAQFQATVGAGRVIFYLLLKGVTSSEADTIVSRGLAKRDRPLIAHHMIAGGDEHQPVFGKGKRLQFFARIDLVPDDTDPGKVLGDGARSRGWNAPPDRMSIWGWRDRNAPNAAGRNSAVAVVLANRCTQPLKPSAYSDSSARIRSNC